jgi:alpha(1,3/1,4) fucosyltransferase
LSAQRQIAVYLDPPSHHFLEDRLLDINAAAHGGDKLLAPYVLLRESLNARGVEVHTSDFLPANGTDSVNLFISFGRLSRYRELASRKDVVLSAFFAMECPTVEPGLYRELGHAQNFYKRVFSWSDSKSLEPFVGQPLRCLPMFWPQSFETVHEGIWERSDRGFLVMINGNKLPRYKTSGHELYSERVRAVRFFGETGDIDLYGIGWDGPTYRVGPWFVPGTFGKAPMPGTAQWIHRRTISLWHRIFPDPRLVAARKVYKGFAKSKSHVLGKYKFALCFENSILKGWTTEKIFDCFFAGTVPVYWGAPDIQEHIPSECFIDMRQFKDYAELKRRLKSMTGREIASYKESARAFLNSPAFQPYTKQTFVDKIMGIVEEDAGVTFGQLVSHQ